MPPVIRLEKGTTLEGRVILPKDLPTDAQYAVKVFRADADLEPSLNPLALQKPLLSRYFPVTESTFTIDGLFAERYTLYIVGDGISATGIDVDASASPERVFILADRPTTTVRGQVRWADTDEPVSDAVVSRSWYPWELHPHDMSMTLDRFEVETDTHGNFEFSTTLFVKKTQDVINGGAFTNRLKCQLQAPHTASISENETVHLLQSSRHTPCAVTSDL